MSSDTVSLLPPSFPSPFPTYPYYIYRTYDCGHPPENIQVTLLSSLRVCHTLLPSPTDREITWQSYNLSRCKRCALALAASVYTAKVSPADLATYVPEEPLNIEIATVQGKRRVGNLEKRDGFLEALNRYRYGPGTVGNYEFHEGIELGKEYQGREGNDIVWSEGETPRCYERALRVLEEEKKNKEESNHKDGGHHSVTMNKVGRSGTWPANNISDSKSPGPQRHSAEASVPAHSRVVRLSGGSAGSQPFSPSPLRHSAGMDDIKSSITEQTPLSSPTSLATIMRNSDGFFVLPQEVTPPTVLPPPLDPRASSQTTQSAPQVEMASSSPQKSSSLIDRAKKRLGRRRKSNERGRESQSSVNSS